MFIKDRGNIKWSSLMLSEHRDKLCKLKEADADITKPELDRQMLQEMDFLIQKAYKKRLNVKFFCFEKNKISNYTGKIENIDKINELLVIKPENNSRQKLKIKNIVGLQLIRS